ncbi:hypothetical protein M0804_008179 [Polistes exclamans]|nr:hypothetical protein M0804_008179 [Polistes exclamans]
MGLMVVKLVVIVVVLVVVVMDVVNVVVWWLGDGGGGSGGGGEKERKKIIFYCVVTDDTVRWNAAISGWPQSRSRWVPTTVVPATGTLDASHQCQIRYKEKSIIKEKIKAIKKGIHYHTISITTLTLTVVEYLKSPTGGSPPAMQSNIPENNNTTTSEDSDDSTPHSGTIAGIKRPSPEPTDVGAKNQRKTKSQKKKKKRDPNEPQKPVSAYALFFRDTQAAIKGQNPNASFGEISKIVASMWDALEIEHKNGLLGNAMASAHMTQQHMQQQVSQQQYMQVPQQQVQVQVPQQQQMIHMSPPRGDSLSSPPPVSASQAAMVGQRQPTNACIRHGCPNPAVANSEWEDEYCSNECVVSHCRDVFTTWVSSNQNPQQNFSTVK